MSRRDYFRERAEKRLTEPYRTVQDEGEAEVRCWNCNRYLGKANRDGQVAGVFPCKYCKAETEV